MGCAQSRRGVYVRPSALESVVFETTSPADFESQKLSNLEEGDFIYTCFRDDGEDPPFLPSDMGMGDEVDTMDGGAEDFGNGNDTWYEIEVDNGLESIAVPANQLLPTYSLSGWNDVLAKDLTTNYSLVTVLFGMSNVLVVEDITDITSHTSTGVLYHPLFAVPAWSTYYAAAMTTNTDIGILVATCTGEF
jgi:hypothetical protein